MHWKKPSTTSGIDIKVSANDAEKFSSFGALGAGFGHPEFKVIETTFDDLFEAEKKI